MESPVLVRDVGCTRIITMNRPAVRNAMDIRMATALHTALRETSHAANVRAVVLAGAGSSFSSGLDVNELAQGDRALIRRVSSQETNPFRALRGLPQPTIAAVDGPAFTGGLELVLSCDLVLASDTATFADTHAKIGVMPAQGMAALLSAAIGVPMAKWMSLTGRPLDACEAHRLGMVARVVEPDHLTPEAEAVAQGLASLDPEVAQSMKALYDQGLEGTRAEWWRLERRMFTVHASAGSTGAPSVGEAAAN